MYQDIIFWALAVGVLVFLEAITIDLVSIWFALGALAAMICAYLTDNILMQITIFLVVSFLSFFLLRPLAKRRFFSRQEATNADRVIGEQGVVTERISNADATGLVKVLGATWTARSADGQEIELDTPVHILRIEGVKVIVEPVRVEVFT